MIPGRLRVDVCPVCQGYTYYGMKRTPAVGENMAHLGRTCYLDSGLFEFAERGM